MLPSWSPDKKQLRQYVVEYALIALAAAVVYLFMLYVAINEKIVGRQTQLILDNQRIIQNNTQALNENSDALYFFQDNFKPYTK